MPKRVVGFAALLGMMVTRSAAAAENGTTTKVSVGPGGLESDGPSDWPAISGDARIVAFYSYATNLVPGDTNGMVDVFVHDRSTGATRRASVSSAGEQANGRSWGQQVDGPGRLVAFASEASNLVAGDANARPTAATRSGEDPDPPREVRARSRQAGGGRERARRPCPQAAPATRGDPPAPSAREPRRRHVRTDPSAVGEARPDMTSV